MAIDIILFDLDGTLTDSKEGICRSAQHALRHFGIDEPDLTKLEIMIGPNLYNSFENIFGLTTEQSTEAVQIFRKRYSEVGWHENEIYPGIADMLAMLKAKGKKLAVASLKPMIFVEKILEHFDIRKYFDAVMGTVLEANRDTKGEVMAMTLAQMGIDLECPDIDRSRIAMVGDRRDDMEGATYCGVFPIGVRYGYSVGDELRLSGARAIVNTVDELSDLLSS